MNVHANEKKEKIMNGVSIWIVEVELKYVLYNVFSF